MKVKRFLKEYFYSDFFRHFLMVTNFLVFFLISFISLTLDTISPFNYINVALAGIFAVVTILYLIVKKQKPAISIFIMCYLIIVLCFLISFAVHGFTSFPKTPILVTLLSIFVFLWMDQNKKYFSFYLLAFLIASWGFLLTFAIVQRYSIIHPNFSKRIGSFFGNENDVARHLLFAFLLNLYYIYAFKPVALKVINSLACLLCCYFVLLTGSISNLLLLFIVVLCFVLLIANKKTKLYFLSGVGLTVIIAVILILAVPSLTPVKNRVFSIFNTLLGTGDYRQDSSTAGRLNATIYGFKLFVSSPLFGNGYNSVVSNYKIMAHNNIAEIGADYGLFALLAEEFILLFPLFTKASVEKKNSIFIKTCSIYIVLLQFFLVTFTSKIECIIIPLIYIALDKNEKLFSLNWIKNRKQKSQYFYEVTI